MTSLCFWEENIKTDHLLRQELHWYTLMEYLGAIFTANVDESFTFSMYSLGFLF